MSKETYPVQVYKIEASVIDHDNLGVEGVRSAIECANYGNHWGPPEVRAIQVEQVDWHDQHPLNSITKSDAEFKRLFPDAVDLNTAGLAMEVDIAKDKLVIAEARIRELEEQLHIHQIVILGNAMNVCGGLENAAKGMCTDWLNNAKAVEQEHREQL